MATLVLNSHSEKQTIAYAKKLASLLHAGDVIGLVGDLGAGKTTFVKGIAQGLGITKSVTSPSFVLLKVYQGKFPLYHFDLYRIRGLRAIEDIGYEDFISDSGVCVIEWADKAKTILPRDCITITLGVRSQRSRLVRIRGNGQRSKKIIVQLKKKSCYGN